MNILAIGNSFSEDATYYLYKIANSAGIDIKVVNLYIGGCSLCTHAKNIQEENPFYRYELNGRHTDRKVSIQEVLKEDNWDIVTVQQQSGRAGVYESYRDNLGAILACIHEHAPKSKVYFHETWAYETDSTHPDFVLYGNDRKKMHTCIHETVRRVCLETGKLPIIPSGDVIDRLRQTDVFDIAKGGMSICRDGYHVDLIYGRYLLGLVWFTSLLNGKIEAVSFIPTEEDIINGYELKHFHCDTQLIQLIKDTVGDYMREESYTNNELSACSDNNIKTQGGTL